jgi:cell division protein FtsW (lipid II flippase)
VFALDAFNPEKTIWQQIGDFLMHLVPSFVLIIFLIFAWKRELVGGIIFVLIGLGFSPFVFIHNYRMNHSIWLSLGIIAMITIPFVLVGILFMMSHKIKKKNLTSLNKNE